MRTWPLIALLVLGGCRGSRSVLYDARPGRAPQEYAVDVPPRYEVRSAGFGAAHAVSVSRGSGTPDERPYLHLYAVDRETGDEVVLIYADIRTQRTPTTMIRLERR